MLAWLAVAGGWMLLLAGAGHLWRSPSLRATLLAHGLVPHRLVGPVAAILPVAEALLGAAVLWAAAGTHAGWWAPATGTAGALTVAYTGYLGVLLRRGETGDCGCGPVPDAVGRFTVARAAVLAVGLVGAAIVGPSGVEALAAVTGRPLLLLSGFAGAVVGLTAHAGRAHSDRTMAVLRSGFTWQVSEEVDP